MGFLGKGGCSVLEGVLGFAGVVRFLLVSCFWGWLVQVGRFACLPLGCLVGCVLPVCPWVLLGFWGLYGLNCSPFVGQFKS